MKLNKLFFHTYVIFLITLLFSSSYSSLLNMSSLLSFKNSATFKEMLEKKHRLKNNVQGKILYQGWVKYFHFSTVDIEIFVLRFLVGSPSVEFRYTETALEFRLFLFFVCY